MANEAEFHFGKRRSNEGLEFVGGRKPQRSFSFDSRSARQPLERERYIAPVESPIPLLPPEAPAQVQAYETDPLMQIYQEPILSAQVEEETPTQPEDFLQAPSTERIEPIIELYEETPKRPSMFRKLAAYTVALAAVGILVTSVMFLMRNKPVITSEIKNKTDYALYEIAPSSTFKVPKESLEIGSEGNLVYFVDNVKTKGRFIVSQQKVPPVVQEEADYNQFLNDFDKYAEFKAGIGTAYFTHPENIGNDVSVVVKTDTTLLFIRGPGDTSEADWTALLNHLKVVK